MFPVIRLLPNGDGTYDLCLEYSSADAEFAKELISTQGEPPKSLMQRVRAYADRAKIRSVKILVSGVLITTMAFSSFLSAFAASDKYTMGYLYHGTEEQQIQSVNQTNGALDTVSPSYFDIQEDGSLKQNNISSSFVDTMHQQGIKVVPFLSNHWNRNAGILALQDVETLSTQIAQAVERHNLDGINVDIENVTHAQRDQYTQLVKLLREKIPRHKEVSVAVAANPNNWQTGWHGSYDYAALATYADHLLIMAYDEHYEGGEAGPVASIGFVERSIQYALERTTADKIVIGVPFYGRVWSTDGGSVTGKGVSTRTIQQILQACPATVTYDQTSQSVRAEFEITASSPQFTVGWNQVLQPGKYVAWFENDDSYQAKFQLVEKYDLKGVGAWSLGQEDPTIWEHYDQWLEGDSSSGPSDPSQGYRIHEVQRGDTLWKIAQTYLGSGSRYPEIMQLNGLTSTNIHPGMLLKIPGTASGDNSTGDAGGSGSADDNSGASFQYTVKQGDSLWSIAQTHLGSGSRYPEIVQLNGLTGTNIYPGMQLQIPGTSPSTPGGSGGGSNSGQATARQYTVKAGDTLWKISQTYLGSGNRYAEIIRLNNLKSDLLTVGQVLKLPAK